MPLATNLSGTNLNSCKLACEAGESQDVTNKLVDWLVIFGYFVALRQMAYQQEVVARNRVICNDNQGCKRLFQKSTLVKIASL
ncbi:hypothetical protein AX660_00380 [Paraglaciecola hydrolytica]|uniref:Uncharacterized protein n=1 Tax=Paraglaciecola hydrolytica TaxID=1799789 RepID=A0A136A6V5_9ALTE|nr:hypothetical protein AX660_00380 [Paraglaciecola hydrolytica]